MIKSPNAFRTISEVAEWLDTPAYVLRFWEGRFSQIKPVKRAGGRRYYRPHDMLLLGGIKQLLHVDKRTIDDVKKILKVKKYSLKYLVIGKPKRLRQDGGSIVYLTIKMCLKLKSQLLILTNHYQTKDISTVLNIGMF